MQLQNPELVTISVWIKRHAPRDDELVGILGIDGSLRKHPAIGYVGFTRYRPVKDILQLDLRFLCSDKTVLRVIPSRATVR